MEDEGHVSDHFSGISAIDGTWHHIAVTWESKSGLAMLYDNGRKVTAEPATSHFLHQCRPVLIILVRKSNREEIVFLVASF
jgi:hypothetical protein